LQRKMEKVEDVVIIGAGIAGLATAVALKRVGVRAVLLERSDELRATGTALSLFPNAWLALDALGVSHKLTPLYVPTIRGSVTNVGTGATQQISFTISSGGTAPRSVHRKVLLEVLAEELPVDTIRFSSKLASLEVQRQKDSPIAVMRLEDGDVIKAKVVVGCDGVHSVVARWLGLGSTVNYGRSVVRGLAVYPQGHGLNQEVQQFVDVGKRAGFVPLSDKELYWYLTHTSKPQAGEMEGDAEAVLREVTENFAKGFPPKYLDVVKHSDPSSLAWGPVTFRLPWDVLFRNACKGNITVAGDAMHPMTPDLAQGGCAALEDAICLGQHIGESVIQHGKLVPRETAKAIQSYVKERRWRVAGLVAGSWLSGWVQVSGSGWLMKFFRDVIFYRFICKRIVDVMHYDCGKLPSISLRHEDCRSKIE
ncbi:hypothetical protein RJ639_025048, partial [Escallonia herrerae]